MSQRKSKPQSKPKPKLATLASRRWLVGRPVFEADAICPLMPVWPWGGHRGWSYDFVRFMRPGVICELGVHWGTSFFAFAQAVKDAKFKSRMIGVDTWAGDGHTGPYGPDVLETVRTIAAKFYLKQSFELLPMTFDEALPSIADASVDLLHIDGFHTYDAVKHDFESWLPKMADDGVVLLHDVADDTGYGSADYWKELLERFPGFHFEHSWGLGVVFPKSHKWIDALRQHGLDDKVLLYTYRAELERSKLELRDTGAMAIERLAAMDEMGRIIGERDRQLSSLHEDANGLRQAIEATNQTRIALRGELDRAVASAAEQIGELRSGREADGQRISALKGSVRTLEESVAQLQTRARELEADLSQTRESLGQTQGSLGRTRESLLQTQASEARNLARAEKTEAELEKTEAELAVIAQELAETHSTLARASDDLARALERERSLRESKVEWEAVNRRLRSELNSARESIRSLRARVAELELLLSQETTRASSLSLELEEENAMNRELSKSLEVVRADVELMAIRIEHLERIQIERESELERAKLDLAGASRGVRTGSSASSRARRGTR